MCATIATATPGPKPGLLAAAYTAPVVAPAVVTAQSSQVFARNYNGLVAPVAPLVAAPAPIVRSAPLVAAAPAPLAYAAPHYHYSPYVAPPVFV